MTALLPRCLQRLLLAYELWELEHHLRDAGRTRRGEAGPVLTPQQIAAAEAEAARLRVRIALLHAPLRRTAWSAA